MANEGVVGSMNTISASFRSGPPTLCTVLCCHELMGMCIIRCHQLGRSCGDSRILPELLPVNAMIFTLCRWDNRLLGSATFEDTGVEDAIECWNGDCLDEAIFDGACSRR